LYVYNNPQVTKGLTLTGIVWALTHNHAGFWHPLTSISHMLDCQLYGLNAGGHHLTNVLLHAATAILLFLVLRRMTGVLWSSAFVAAVFAIHPLRVESVAWVAERKDVLSGLFFMLTLLMYVRYIEKSKVQSPKSRVFYGLALLFFTLGLMSKQMLVTLPFVLLLLDYWPLERFTIYDLRFTIPRLLLEKLPLLLLAIAAGFIAFLMQNSYGAMVTPEGLPIGSRLANGLVSYVTYILKMFWPDNLAVFYPYPAGTPTWEIAVAGALLLFVTIQAVRFARRCPYLLVGWLWYLGMLVPVIGLVQVGAQSHADRFTYLPQIGLYLVMVWAVRDVTASWRYRRQVLGAAAGIVIATLMAGAWRQTSYWRNNETLWTHTLACTSGNYLAHNNLGDALMGQGRFAEAIKHFQKVIEIKPGFAAAFNNLGTAFLNQGRLDEAAEYYHRALEIYPGFAEVHNNLGLLLARQGRAAEAIEQYQKAIELNTNHAEFYINLGNLLAAQGRTAGANAQLHRAIELKPDFAEAYYNLGMAFGTLGQLDEAVGQYRKAIQLKPGYANAHGNLANVLVAQGRLDEAITEYQQTLALEPKSAQAHYRFGQALQTQHKYEAAEKEYQKALEWEPRHLPAHLSLAWLMATCPEATIRNGDKAVEQVEQAGLISGAESSQQLDTLAAAYAEAGRYPEAVKTVTRALNLATTNHDETLVNGLRTQLKLYEANAPYHEPPQ
jgi:tetratricopeptide (TPR) repeat protein